MLEPEGERFDLILESVGGPSLAAALRRVAPGGVVVTFGDSSGEPVRFGARDFYRSTGATLYAFLIFSELDRRGTGSADLERLARLIAAGKLDPAHQRRGELARGRPGAGGAAGAPRAGQGRAARGLAPRARRVAGRTRPEEVCQLGVRMGRPVGTPADADGGAEAGHDLQCDGTRHVRNRTRTEPSQRRPAHRLPTQPQ